MSFHLQMRLSAVNVKPYILWACQGLVQVLLVEPKGIVNTGNSGGELTAENDIWV
jgi:hypothetical protein